MSTVKTNNILDASGGNTATINSMTPTADSLQGFRNRLINPDMRIDQRNAGAAVTLSSSGVFPVDRFQCDEDTDGVMTGQQSTTAPTGFINSLLITTTTADASLGATQYAAVLQKIEGTNVSDLGWGTANAKTVTLSFWVRSSLTGTFGGALANSAWNRSYPFTYSISAANTWEQKSITIAGDTSGTWLTTTGIGLRLVFGLGVGSTYSGTANAWAGSTLFSTTGAVSVIGTLNATWYITGVQLEVGSVATPFERRDYGRELIMCQRYYQQVGQTNNTAFQPYANGFVSSSTRASIIYNFPVTMRSAPTFTFNGATNTYLSAAVSVTAVNIDIASVYNVMYNADVASGLTTGNATRHYQNSTNASSITLSSEL